MTRISSTRAQPVLYGRDGLPVLSHDGASLRGWITRNDVLRVLAERVMRRGRDRGRCPGRPVCRRALEKTPSRPEHAAGGLRARGAGGRGSVAGARTPVGRCQLAFGLPRGRGHPGARGSRGERRAATSGRRAGSCWPLPATRPRRRFCPMGTRHLAKTGADSRLARPSPERGVARAQPGAPTSGISLGGASAFSGVVDVQAARRSAMCVCATATCRARLSEL